MTGDQNATTDVLHLNCFLPHDIGNINWPPFSDTLDNFEFCERDTFS